MTLASLAIALALAICGAHAADPAQDDDSPWTNPPETAKTEMPAPGEFSLRDETNRILDPDSPPPGQSAPVIQPRSGWIPMKLLFTDQPPPGTEEVMTAWAATRPNYHKGTEGRAALLYQVYASETEKAIVMIGKTANCIPGTVAAPGSVITLCPIETWVVTNTTRPHLLPRRLGCFQWNGQAAPGSKLDPQYNANYTRYNPTAHTIDVYTIKNARPWARCQKTLDLTRREASPE